MLLISLISWGGVLEKPITQSWWRGKLNGKLWSMLCVLKKPWLLAISPTSDTYWVLVAMIVSWKILSRHTFHLYHKIEKTTWMFWCILSAFGLIRTPTKIWSLCTSFPESTWRCRVSGVVFSSVCPGPISRRFPPKNKSTGDRCIVFYAWI